VGRTAQAKKQVCIKAEAGQAVCGVSRVSAFSGSAAGHASSRAVNAVRAFLNPGDSGERSLECASRKSQTI
jgi:hypothetical protein